jgi:hypothetical protein
MMGSVMAENELTRKEPGPGPSKMFLHAGPPRVSTLNSQLVTKKDLEGLATKKDLYGTFVALVLIFVMEVAILFVLELFVWK